ncbi:MAG: hydrogenase maturation nickel metallochaperone HypA [Oscillospiraceae bacterium]|jgi:Zn finger protein HypA/HybF (possibly regulating hydrogenase expression)|nr:hydrogenase maturation nickel metallochaperone HypA [Oscillospiraceae bacterium]
MHELGICDALLKMVRGIMKDEELTEIESITVEVGSLSGVMPSFLADCWVAVADGTELQETEFVIEELAGTASCMDCGAEFTADLNDLRCPKCRGNKLMPLTGRDLTLKEILAP